MQLPGDRRGFVSSVKDGAGPQIRHNIPRTQYDRDLPRLQDSARRLMKQPAVLLTSDDAVAVGQQIGETAEYRQWKLLAAAAMANHVHVVVGVPGDPSPESLLRDFKSYASRVLNKNHVRSEAKRWWTRSGSRRKLTDDGAIATAIQYVERQERPLFLWSINSPHPEAGEHRA